MSIEQQSSFVELNRRFRKLEPKEKAEQAALESYTKFFWRRDASTWDDLLKENRVIILGEPGSGKSWEMRERARLLTSQGAFAFFVRLDQLVERELNGVLIPDEQTHFIRWKQSQSAAHFFLDSVDEAKFRRVSDFHAALIKMHIELGSNFLSRAKIFLSSRISEWKPLTDGFEFQRLFPLPPVEMGTGDGQSKQLESANSELLVVQLEPLNRVQVECLAGARGLPDVKTFTEELDRAFAWEFARRPLDVANLIDFWKANGRIGLLTELIEFDVSSKLRPREGRDEFALSADEGREGAEWLAAASLFSRRFSFCVPDDGATSADSLNPRDCLPSHWRDDQIRALLNRAIIDSATYGHFRFHHRRVGEYLAARWLAGCMENGCPQIELEHLLADVVQGRKVLRLSLRSIAAWLCSGGAPWNMFVRTLVLDTDPGIHLQYGDPAGLPIEYRREVLLALSRQARSRRRMWIESSADSLARLADSALSADIAELISDRGLALDLRIELLGIVRHGRLTACADAAFRVIESTDEPVKLKSHAASAIGAIDDSKLHARLVQVVCQLPQIPNRLCTSLVQALYPKSLSSAQLVELLAKMETVREFSVDLTYYLKSHFESVVTPDNAGELLTRLNALAATPPFVRHGEKTLPVSEQFHCIAKVIPTVLEILLQKAVLLEEETTAAAVSLQLLGHFNELDHFYREDLGELNKSILRHPEVRRNYLWRIVTEFRREHNNEPARSLNLFDHWEIMRLCPDDFLWLVEDIQRRTEPNDRLLALRLAIEVWDQSGRKLTSYWRMRRAILTDASLCAPFRESVVTGLLLPLKRYWWQRVRHKYGEWWWIEKRRTIRQHWQLIRERLFLLRHLRLVESGKQFDWLVALSREAGKRNSSHWTPSTWADLERKRGKRITRAAKCGCIAAWRGYTPQLPHQKTKPNQTSYRVIVGLSGLQLEFDKNPVTFSKLSSDEATLAARYAMDELNGFPGWLESLASQHPNAVGGILRECVEGEWQFPANRERVHEVLAKLAWQGECLVHLVQPRLLSLLGTGDPRNQEILRFALSVLMRQPNPPLNELAGFAALRTSPESDRVYVALWLAVWMHIDGEAAVTRLADLIKNSETPDALVIKLCSILSGEEMERGPFYANPSFLRAGCLGRLIPLVYHHVRFADDLDRRGGAYTPTARDHAQRFRGMLLNQLENDEDSAATDVLRELAEEPAMSGLRDWILNLIDKRRVSEADSTPWTPADLREFAERHEIDPKTDRELFAIARKRFQVLKWDVERSDNSARTELHKDYPEMELRRWLQRRLIERSQKRYTIPQELEIDQQKRPDLRFENPRTGPVSVEVKWADNWTLALLLERLENQLVGKYLRAHDSRFGIYFLGFIGKKQYWKEPTTGKRLNFEEIVNIVRERAIALEHANPKVAGLDVVGIDFLNPERA